MRSNYFYVLNMTGMRALFIMPHPVMILDNAKAFMEQHTAEETERMVFDVTVTFEEKDVLPEMTGEEKRYSDSFYSLMTKDDPYSLQVWHVSGMCGDPPYGYTKWIDQKHAVVWFTPGSLKYVEMSRQLMDLLGSETYLLFHHAFILHSSLIDYKGHGILFSAASGTGKSTQANLWQEHMHADILNGDRAGLAKKDGQWFAYGLPYAGSSSIYRNESVPVRMVIMLSQAKENVLIPLSHFQAGIQLYSQVMLHHWDPVYIQRAMDLIEQFTADVPVYSLACRPDTGAVEAVLKELEERIVEL